MLSAMHTQKKGAGAAFYCTARTLSKKQRSSKNPNLKVKTQRDEQHATEQPNVELTARHSGPYFTSVKAKHTRQLLDTRRNFRTQQRDDPR